MLLEQITGSTLANGLAFAAAPHALSAPVVAVAGSLGAAAGARAVWLHLLVRALQDAHYAGAVVLCLGGAAAPAAVAGWCAPLLAADPAAAARLVCIPAPAIADADAASAEDAVTSAISDSAAAAAVASFAPRCYAPAALAGAARAAAAARLGGCGRPVALFVAGAEALLAQPPFRLCAHSHSDSLANASAAAPCAGPTAPMAAFPAFVRALFPPQPLLSSSASATSAAPASVPASASASASASAPASVQLASLVVLLHADALPADAAVSSAVPPAAAAPGAAGFAAASPLLESVLSAASTVVAALAPPAPGALAAPAAARGPALLCARVLHRKSTGGPVRAGLEALYRVGGAAGARAGGLALLGQPVAELQALGLAAAARAAEDEAQNGELDRLTQGLSFKLSLTARQKLARAGVQLPYHTGQPDESAAGSSPAAGLALAQSGLLTGSGAGGSASSGSGVLLAGSALGDALAAHVARNTSVSAAGIESDGEVIDDFDDEEI